MSKGHGLPHIAIKDFAEVVTGGTPSTVIKEYWENGKIPWLNSGELNNRFITNSSNYITEAGLKNSNAKMMPLDTVLIALTGATTGVTALLKIEACANQSVTGILPSDNHDPKYLFFYLNSLRQQILDKSWGGAQKHISQGYVKEIEVPLPPLPEQRRIAAILDKADAVRRKRQESIRLTEEFLRSVFLDMFGDPVTNSKGWKVVKFGELCEELRYGTSTMCSTDWKKDDLPVLRIPNVIGEQINWDDLKYAHIPKAERSRLMLQKGDILFVRTNGNPENIGRCAVYEDEKEALYASYLIRARLKKDSPILSLYINSCFSFPTYRGKVVAEAKTTAGNYNINTEGLRSLKIPLPPLNRQKQFTELMAKTTKVRNQLESGMENMDGLFNSLVQHAFRGEL